MHSTETLASIIWPSTTFLVKEPVDIGMIFGVALHRGIFAPEHVGVGRNGLNDCSVLCDLVTVQEKHR